jgi:hypothetical protein
MPKTIEAEEFRLVDSRGNLRARLGIQDEQTILELRTVTGHLALKVGAGPEGIAAIRIYDESSNKPRIELSIDAQGSHMHFAGGESQQSYLFLKKTGATGVVLTDSKGTRKAEVLVSAEGNASIAVWDSTGAMKSLT